MSNTLSDFGRLTVEVYGETGREWLQRLPDLLTHCAARWALTLEPPFDPLTYNYAAPAVRADGTRVVLKVGVPCRELATEVEALRLFDGQGAVRLLDADADKGILLLERLMPGAPLLSVPDDGQATGIAASVMQGLRRPAPAGHTFPTVAEWFAGLARLRAQFDGGTGPFSTRLVEEAEALSAELIQSTAETALLHGDLHHGNILRAGRAPWLAIDPKGVVGDPAFEPSAFLLNPVPQPAESSGAASRSSPRFWICPASGCAAGGWHAPSFPRAGPWRTTAQTGRPR